jgi:hypothetical protein
MFAAIFLFALACFACVDCILLVRYIFPRLVSIRFVRGTFLLPLPVPNLVHDIFPETDLVANNNLVLAHQLQDPNDPNNDLVLRNRLLESARDVRRSTYVDEKVDLQNRAPTAYVDYICPLYQDTRLAIWYALCSFLTVDICFGRLLRSFSRWLYTLSAPFIGLFNQHFHQLFTGQNPQNSILRVHFPSASKAMASLTPMLHGAFRNFHFKTPQKYNTNLRSFYFVKEVLSKVVSHIIAHEELVYEAQHINQFANYVVLLFLHRNNLPMPIIDPFNYVNDDFTETPIRNYIQQYLNQYILIVLNWMRPGLRQVRNRNWHLGNQMFAINIVEATLTSIPFIGRFLSLAHIVPRIINILFDIFIVQTLEKNLDFQSATVGLVLGEGSIPTQK